MKLKNLLLGCTLVLTSFSSYAQQTYVFSTSTQTYQNIDPDQATIIDDTNGWDDAINYTIPIGFDFDLFGETISELSFFDNTSNAN